MFHAEMVLLRLFFYARRTHARDTWTIGLAVNAVVSAIGPTGDRGMICQCWCLHGRSFEKVAADAPCHAWHPNFDVGESELAKLFEAPLNVIVDVVFDLLFTVAAG